MSIRLKCCSCQTAFVKADDQAGLRVTCPKCGTEQIASSASPAPRAAPATTKEPAVRPTPAAASAPARRLTTAAASAPAAEDAKSSVFVASEPPRRPGRLLRLGLGFVVILSAAAVAVAVAWPALERWWHPLPRDPVSLAATAYLKALTDGDYEAARRLGTVDEPPAIRSFRNIELLPGSNRSLKGSFAPLAALHARINEKFEYDPAIGRFKVRDPLGPAAETLDALHDAKAKAEQEKLYKKMASGDPNDLFDAAEGLGGAFAKLAEGALAPKKLVPTYKQLVQDAKPPLPPTEAELAFDYAAHRETWDALLKRPFPSLKADGPFRLDRAAVAATVRDRLASSGDPPTTLRLDLVRFRLEGIDTGWKVVSARRPSALPEPAAESEPAQLSPEPVRRSPGETTP